MPTVAETEAGKRPSPEVLGDVEPKVHELEEATAVAPTPTPISPAEVLEPPAIAAEPEAPEAVVPKVDSLEASEASAAAPHPEEPTRVLQPSSKAVSFAVPEARKAKRDGNAQPGTGAWWPTTPREQRAVPWGPRA